VKEISVITPLRQTQFLPGTLKNLFYPPERTEYTYFARAKECPFVNGNAIVKAAWAADASMLSYARYGAARMPDNDLFANFGRGGLDCRKIGDWNAPGTQAVFASCDDFAILAFRGTEGDDPKDCEYDADFVLVFEQDCHPHHTATTGILASMTHLFSPPCLVHQGFRNALEEVWKDVQRIVADYRAKRPAAEIVFTGHSLGGALAALAFSRFADPNSSLFTFGCPRVGDAPFRDRVLSNPGKGIYRIVNFDDAVTHVPLASLLYEQIPTRSYRFDANGNLNPGDDTFLGDLASLRTAFQGLPSNLMTLDLAQIAAPLSAVDHSPARYCMRLWDCV
jgi:triacylglycerol lipase